MKTQLSNKKRFYKFLSDNDALIEWSRNIRTVGKNSNFLFSRIGVYDYIDEAFTWDSTPEGIEFWSTIYSKWAAENDQLRLR
jgi:hypothetical protein